MTVNKSNKKKTRKTPAALLRIFLHTIHAPFYETSFTFTLGALRFVSFPPALQFFSLLVLFLLFLFFFSLSYSTPSPRYVFSLIQCHVSSAGQHRPSHAPPRDGRIARGNELQILSQEKGRSTLRTVFRGLLTDLTDQMQSPATELRGLQGLPVSLHLR